jgi:hypothetical protein
MADLEKELKELGEKLAKAVLEYKEITGVDYDPKGKCAKALPPVKAKKDKKDEKARNESKAVKRLKEEVQYTLCSLCSLYSLYIVPTYTSYTALGARELSGCRGLGGPEGYAGGGD